MIVTSYKQWQEWVTTYSMLPFIRAYPLLEARVMDWQQAWEQASEGSFVLESGKDGRYSFLGLKPSASIRGKYTDTPLKKIKQWMEPFRSPVVGHAPKFIGGCVGFLGYDTVRSLERLPQAAIDDLTLPDFVMMRFDQLWIMDHETSTLYCAYHIYMPEQEESIDQLYEAAAAQTEAMKQQWDTIVEGGRSERVRARKDLFQAAVQTGNLQVDVDQLAHVERDFAKLDYMHAVERIKQYIAQGDVFQVNLSIRQSRKLIHPDTGESILPEEIYEWLRLLNPSPYMGMLRFADFQLVCASPELLVQVEGNQVRTRPIAGTRPRGLNQEEDAKLADELIHNEKERAEHVMLVDLQRNDLGKIARYGTVRVDDFMVIERYSHVMHIVSEVKAELAAGKDAYDVLAAVFPGGTITGAPKVRTMEIIEELEPVRRGPYTGTMGWIDYNGNMEFNMVIRTMVVTNQTAFIQAGAGIVIDSDPEKEYMESINKAKALWKAIEFSEQRMKASILKG
ncbi:MAG: anthranilate synthase component I family protein [Paenibacillaceae bacterium]